MVPLAFMGFILGYSLTFSLVEIPSRVELSLLLSYSCNHSEPAYFRVRDFPLWPTKHGNWRAHLLGDGQDFWFCYRSKYPAAAAPPGHGQSAVKSLLGWLYQMSRSMR